MLLKTIVVLTNFLAARLHRDDRGATAVEYVLLVTFIAVAIIVAVTAFGTALAGLFTSTTGKL